MNINKSNVVNHLKEALEGLGKVENKEAKKIAQKHCGILDEYAKDKTANLSDIVRNISKDVRTARQTAKKNKLDATVFEMYESNTDIQDIAVRYFHNEG
jgi:hypothetical protein